MKVLVAYLRVSTDRQGKSGLGIEAQKFGACLRAIANAKAPMATVAMNQPGRLARSARPINRRSRSA
jgi:hypothetical protein